MSTNFYVYYAHVRDRLWLIKDSSAKATGDVPPERLVHDDKKTGPAEALLVSAFRAMDSSPLRAVGDLLYYLAWCARRDGLAAVTPTDAAAEGAQAPAGAAAGGSKPGSGAAAAAGPVGESARFVYRTSILAYQAMLGRGRF